MSAMKLVLVEWLDAHAGRGWQTAEQLERAAEPLRCLSVGWLLKRTRECVVLVPHVSGGKEYGQMLSGCGDLTIPQVMIKKITTLRR